MSDDKAWDKFDFESVGDTGWICNSCNVACCGNRGCASFNGVCLVSTAGWTRVGVFGMQKTRHGELHCLPSCNGYKPKCNGIPIWFGTVVPLTGVKLGTVNAYCNTSSLWSALPRCQSSLLVFFQHQPITGNVHSFIVSTG